MAKPAKLGTRAVWAGEEEYLMQGATQVSVVHSISFGYRDMDEWLQVALGEKDGHIYGHPAANLGSVETIVGPPATTSHVECTAAERAAMGIPESLVRYSTEIEDTSDLISHLDQALKPFV